MTFEEMQEERKRLIVEWVKIKKQIALHEEKMAEMCCPFKLGQLFSFVSPKGIKYKGVITLIEFQTLPPYFRIYGCLFDKRKWLTPEHRIYRPELIVTIENGSDEIDEVMLKRANELREKKVIRPEGYVDPTKIMYRKPKSKR